MMRTRTFVTIGVLGACGIAVGDPAPDRALGEIAQLDKAIDAATRKMDNAAILALWADDGVSLLPSTKPLVGKPAIGKFLDEVLGSLKGAKMKAFEQECHDIEVSGAWASEWCTEHQLVELPGGKPPFEGWGKLLLVLHKGADGKWRIAREMWNEAVKP